MAPSVRSTATTAPSRDPFLHFLASTNPRRQDGVDSGGASGGGARCVRRGASHRFPRAPAASSTAFCAVVAFLPPPPDVQDKVLRIPATGF